jgi:hypothetical protein
VWRGQRDGSPRPYSPISRPYSACIHFLKWFKMTLKPWNDFHWTPYQRNEATQEITRSAQVVQLVLPPESNPRVVVCKHLEAISAWHWPTIHDYQIRNRPSHPRVQQLWRGRLVCPKGTYIDADRGTKETILSSPGIVGSIVRYLLPPLSIILSLSFRFSKPLVCCFLTCSLNAIL